MNARSLAMLAAVAAIVIAAAVWLSVARHQPQQTSTLLYPSLKTQLDKVQSLRIDAAGNRHAVELKRSQNDWRISERFGYPASSEKVRQLLLDLSEAKLVEEKTSNPANYPALGVEDTTASTAGGVRLQLAGPQGIDLIVGKTAPSMNSRYVRKSAEKRSWLIDRSLDAPPEPKEWLEPQLIDVAVDRMHSAHIAIEGKQSYTAAKSKPGESNFTVSDLKKGQSLNTEAAANGVGTSLVGLTLVDVAPIAQWQSQKPHAKATYTTFDGLAIELTGWVDGAAHWLSARAHYSEPSTPPPADQAKPAPDRKAEAATLDAKLSPWAFQVPEYKYGAIFQPVEDILKK